MRVIDRIRVPALIITAEDDPFVPSRRRSAIRSSRRIRTSTSIITPHGGHCGVRRRAHATATTDTGREHRSSTFAETRGRSVTSRYSSDHQPLRELRPQSLLFVLEVDERVLARRADPSNDAGPALDVRLLIALVAQPEVGVVGGHLDRRAQLLAVGDAEREVAAAQDVEDVGVEPRRMAELERRARAVGQHAR